MHCCERIVGIQFKQIKCHQRTYRKCYAGRKFLSGDSYFPNAVTQKPAMAAATLRIDFSVNNPSLNSPYDSEEILSQ